MEHPAEEWDRAALQLGPVRIDIPWSAKGRPRPVRRADWAIGLTLALLLASPVCFVFSLDTIWNDGWPALAWMTGGTLVAWVLMGLAMRAYWRAFNRARRQVVYLDGMTLTVEYFRSGERTVTRYPILEMHDLRLLSRYEMYGEGAARHARSTSTYWPERIAFTHGGRAYSFGGSVDDETALRAFKAIVDYDARLRAALGMPEAPNITTYDSSRAMQAAAEGYDTDKSPFEF